MVRVDTDGEARRLRFPGSPTIRIDGRDVFPTGELADGSLGCRVYATPEGLAATPTAEMIEQALGSVAPEPVSDVLDGDASHRPHE